MWTTGRQGRLLLSVIYTCCKQKISVTSRSESDQDLEAHSYVLVSRSCVFHAMLCGPLAEKGEITIPDIEPDVFMEFLRYLYTDRVTLTTNNVTGLLYTSRKYTVDTLHEMCVTFLEKNLTEENVYQVLKHCLSYGEIEVQEMCFTLLENSLSEKNVYQILENCHDYREFGLQEMCLSFLENSLSEENVYQILENCHDYREFGLQEMCLSFLENSLSEENVCRILEYYHVFSDKDLEQNALTILIKAGMAVIKSPGFLNLCSDCLETFLKSEQLDLNEKEVFEAVLSWAEAKCKEFDEEPNHENLKKHLGLMRYEIRFTEFTLGYLLNVVEPSGLLTNVELVRIMDKIVNRDIDISPFKEGPRKKPLKYVHRYSFRFGSIRSGEPQAVSFNVSKNIILVGCQLFGPCHKVQSTFDLEVFLLDDRDLIIGQPVLATDMKLRGQWKLSDIMFPDPIPLVAGRTYTIFATLVGENTILGRDGRSSVTANDVIFTFSNSRYSTYTTVKEGQIPGLIWL